MEENLKALLFCAIVKSIDLFNEECLYEKRRSFTESLVFLVRRWGKKKPCHRIFRGKIGRLFKCHMTGVFTMILTSIRQRKMRVVS